MPAGVYRITCVPTGDSYIGSSTAVAKRWDGHRAALRRGKHQLQALQDLWNKYQETSFLFELLERVDPDELEAKEASYLETLRPTLNPTDRVKRAPLRVPKKTTTVRLPEPLLERLQSISLLFKRTQSDLMAEALEEYFTRNNLNRRYQLHVTDSYATLFKVEAGKVDLVEVKNIDSSDDASEILLFYRTKLHEPVELKSYPLDKKEKAS